MINNIISYIDHILIKLPALKYLYMDYNYIAKIGKETFKLNSKLEIICLSHNIIITIKFDLVQLPLLRTLDLSFNFLTSIEERVFSPLSEPSVKQRLNITMTCNMFKCSCDLQWILKDKYRNSLGITNGNKVCTSFKNTTTVKSIVYYDMQQFVIHLCDSINVTCFKHG